MSNVNITTDDLRDVSSRLQNLSSQMSGIAQTMEQSVRGMDSWSDARAEQFMEQVSAVCRGLHLHIDSFNRMSVFLNKYAQQQEEAERAMKASLNNIL